MSRSMVKLLRHTGMLVVPLIVVILVLQPKPAAAFTVAAHTPTSYGGISSMSIPWARYDNFWMSDQIWPYTGTQLQTGDTLTDRIWLNQVGWDQMNVYWKIGWDTRFFQTPVVASLGGYVAPSRYTIEQQPGYSWMWKVRVEFDNMTPSDVGAADVRFVYNGGHVWWNFTYADDLQQWYQATVGQRLVQTDPARVGGGAFQAQGNLLRNYSFETGTTSYWNLFGYDPNDPQHPNWGVYSGGAYSGNYWTEYNSGGKSWTSVFQDRQFGSYPSDGGFGEYVALRCPVSNPGDCPVTVAMWVWGLGNPQEARSWTFNVPRDGNWRSYGFVGSAFSYVHDWMRYEVYNEQSGYNVDIDWNGLF